MGYVEINCRVWMEDENWLSSGNNAVADSIVIREKPAVTICVYLG